MSCNFSTPNPFHNIFTIGSNSKILFSFEFWYQSNTTKEEPDGMMAYKASHPLPQFLWKSKDCTLRSAHSSLLRGWDCEPGPPRPENSCFSSLSFPTLNSTLPPGLSVFLGFWGHVSLEFLTHERSFQSRRYCHWYKVSSRTG